ncbi:MAG: hypothetical protein LBR94_00835 [Desulfovibrio sp.]|nr:hypothetical protein [Desulfovibrio sp.]
MANLDSFGRGPGGDVLFVGKTRVYRTPDFWRGSSHRFGGVDGDAIMRVDTGWAFAKAAEHARRKHPVPARRKLHVICILLEEVLEFAWALLFQGPERAREEAGHIVAVIVRWMEGE